MHLKLIHSVTVRKFTQPKHRSHPQPLVGTLLQTRCHLCFWFYTVRISIRRLAPYTNPNVSMLGSKLVPQRTPIRAVFLFQLTLCFRKKMLYPSKKCESLWIETVQVAAHVR